jgi:hypothetical protein
MLLLVGKLMAEISSVHIDIARFCREVYRISDDTDLGKWTRSLTECLVMRDQSKHEYGAFLLREVEEYRKKEADRKKKHGKDSALSVDSKDSALSDLNQSFNHSDNQSNSHSFKTQELENAFEVARKAYPGQKNGLKREYENFGKRVGKDAPVVIPLLIAAVESEKAYKAALRARGAFCPEWANFQTWVNQRRWEQELPDVSQLPAKGQQKTDSREKQKGREYDEHLTL